MSFYADLVADVEELITEFGTTYPVQAEGTFDEATLTTTDGTNRTVAGVVITDRELLKVIANSADMTSTKMLLMVPSAAPLINEKVKVESKWYSFNDVEKLKPADTVLLYMLDVSR